MRYFALEKLINLYDGYRKAFVIDNKQLLLVEEKGRHYLIQSNCPHMDWPLIDATIKDGTITCAKHGLSYQMNSGNPCASNKLPCRKLASYELVFQGNTIGFYSEPN